MRRFYGVLEKQFRNYYRVADRQRGATGRTCCVFWNGGWTTWCTAWATAVRAPRARQLVSAQGHSRQRPGGERALLSSAPGRHRRRAHGIKRQLRIRAALELASQRGAVEWVEVDTEKMEGLYKRDPDRSELPQEINENLIVELYSK